MTEQKLCPMKQGRADDIFVLQDTELTKTEFDKRLGCQKGFLAKTGVFSGTI